MKRRKSGQTGRPTWKLFEQAVAAFMQALDGQAVVKADVRLPDLDTGSLRQRDVWIETTFGGHIPIRILVSCKREKRKLNEQDIDAFIGELKSSGASKGVIYSYGGYTAPALKKADRLDISCCTLYEGRPPDVPEVLRFRSYCFREAMRLLIYHDGFNDAEAVRSLLRADLCVDGSIISVLSALAAGYDANRPHLSADMFRAEPPTWSCRLVIPSLGEAENVAIELQSVWRVYEAVQSAWLLNGSYSFSNSQFKGSFTTPAVDRFGAHPGQGWVELGSQSQRNQTDFIAMIFHGPNVEQTLRDLYGL